MEIKKEHITFRMFSQFDEIRKSGTMNMLDVQRGIEQTDQPELDREQWIFILKNYDHLSEIYGREELIKKTLRSEQWEIDWCKDENIVIFQDYSEFGIEAEIQLELNSDLFNTEVWENAKGTNDPCEVVSTGMKNIFDVDDILDTFCTSDIAEVFHKNINHIKIQSI